MVAVKEIMSRLSKVQKQLLEIQRVEGAADKVGFKISGFMTFLAGDNSVGEITFNVPKYAPFEAHSLNLYAGYRQIDLQTPRQSDVTFRPIDYLHAARFFDFGTAVNVQNAINLTFSLRDSKWGEGQNADCSVLSSFSGRVPTISQPIAAAPFASVSQTPVTGWLGALRFKKNYRLDPGMTLTARVTPKFSFNAASAATRREYRVFGVLEGHRLVWRK